MGHHMFQKALSKHTGRILVRQPGTSRANLSHLLLWRGGEGEPRAELAMPVGHMEVAGLPQEEAWTDSC